MNCKIVKMKKFFTEIFFNSLEFLETVTKKILR